MTAQEIPTIVVSRLPATVGSDTAKILLAAPAKKLPSAALTKSNQLVRDSKITSQGIVRELRQESRTPATPPHFTNAVPQAGCKTPGRILPSEATQPRRPAAVIGHCESSANGPRPCV